ncbi:MAG: ABC transporter ATP-binding protein [Eubacteriales bacterium]|nr:ABC transporter ATP-binding protein [Eubacteriales bacterium]
MSKAIEVRDVEKVYRLYDKNTDRLKESLGLTKKKLHKDFYALKGVSFDVEEGRSVGIIGTNGSGKSTMLKIITGVLTPTSGTVSVRGKVSALLELGAGFNMEYTGIENIYMNGTMMGFTKEEMDGKLDEILKFADIGDFVYQPVKSYSSGMFVRLAFALAINVEPEILIVDEALSVGDIFFQSKCYHHMDKLRKNGTTILMVTHDMSSVLKYCDKAILLNDGEKVSEGRPGEIIDLYKRILAGQYNADEVLKSQQENASGLSNNAEIAGEDKQAEPSDDGKVTGVSENAAEHAAAAVQDNGTELMRSSMNINPNLNEYGDKRAEIYDFGILDKDGRLTNLILKGEEFTIRERIRFNAAVEAPIFTYTFRDKKGNDLSGTNTLFENAEVEAAKKGDTYEVEFKQRMDLQGGEYLLSMSCTGFEQGEHVVYHRLYDLLNLTVISNKNTVGVYDMNSAVKVKKN